MDTSVIVLDILAFIGFFALLVAFWVYGRKGFAKFLSALKARAVAKAATALAQQVAAVAPAVAPVVSRMDRAEAAIKLLQARLGPPAANPQTAVPGGQPAPTVQAPPAPLPV